MRGVLDIPASLEPVAEVLIDALSRVEQRFDAQLTSDLIPVSELVTHVEKYRGKMLRPIISLLSGLACNPDAGADGKDGGALSPSLLGDRHIVVAAVCEMVHMATLVHDDVLDEADQRRGGLTVNRLRGNEPAVMLGDYLIASAYELCTQLGEAHTAGIVGRMSMAMCAGELLQLHHRGDFELDEPTYFEIVERKTGALIGAAASLGAIASKAPEPVVASMDRVGRDLGIAFQIQDDLLDLAGEERVVGKSVGKDVEKSKLTLPLIHHLSACAPVERAISIALLESAARGEASRSELASRAQATGSIAYARATASEYVERARAAIASLRPSPAREVLDLLAAAVIDRDK